MGALLTIDKSYSMQRLLKDYNELKNQIIPVQGVSAAPLDDNLYKWHANVKALADNPYKNMVLHLWMIFYKDPSCRHLLLLLAVPLNVIAHAAAVTPT